MIIRRTWSGAQLFGAMLRQIDLLPLPAGWGPLPVGRISGISRGEAEVSENLRRKRVEMPVARIRKAHRCLPNDTPASGLQKRACNGPVGGSFGLLKRKFRLM